MEHVVDHDGPSAFQFPVGTTNSLEAVGDGDEQPIAVKRLRIERPDKARKGTARSIALTKIAAFSASHPGALKRGRNGGPSIKWVSRLAGLPDSTIYADKVLVEAIMDLERTHGLVDAPKVTPARYKVAGASVIVEIEKLGVDLAAGKAAPPAEGVTAAWVANLIGASTAGIVDSPEQRGAVRELDRLYGSSRASAESGGTTTVPAKVTEALEKLDAWDELLERSGDRVPSRNGVPATEVIGGLIECPRNWLRHPAAQRRLFEIARRHGYKSAALSRAHRLATINRILLADEADTLMLRGDSFPTTVAGALDLAALTERISVSLEASFDRAFRADAISHQLRLCRSGGHECPARSELEKLTSLATVDIYRVLVSEGDRTPPLTHDGLLMVSAFEKELGLVVGGASRFPDILRKMEDIAVLVGGANLAERTAEARQRKLAYVVSVIGSVGDSMLAKGQRVKLTLAGEVARGSLSRTLQTKLDGVFEHELVQRAIERLVAKVGIDEKDKQTVEDVLVEHHRRRVRTGLCPHPTASLNDDQLLDEWIAADTGIAVAEITPIHRDRVRREIRQNRKIAEDRPSYPNSARGLETLLKRALALAQFDKGLPEDPLFPKSPDLIEISKVAGISVSSLERVGSYVALINAKVKQVGFALASHPALRITPAELHGHAVYMTAKLPGHDSNHSRSLASAKQALAAVLSARGESLTGPLSNGLFGDASWGLANGAVRYLQFWKATLADLILQLSPGTDLATTLKLLCRNFGHRPRDILSKLGFGNYARHWFSGVAEPAWRLQEQVDALEREFDVAAGELTNRINGDHRRAGRRTPEGMPQPWFCHLPHQFWTFPLEQRLPILNEIADLAVQNDPKSQRRRLLSFDAYRLPYKKWPQHLKDEFDVFLAAKESENWSENANEDADEYDDLDDDLFADDEEESTKAPLKDGGKNRYKSIFEEFFGFLHLPQAFEAEQNIIHPNTPDWRREAALAKARAIKYRRRPGFGVPLDKLSFGLLEHWSLVQAFMLYRRNRAGHYDWNALNFANQCQVAVRVGGPVRDSVSMAERAQAFISWFASKESADLPNRVELASTDDGPSAHLDRCEEALKKYDVAYGKLKKRRHAKGKKRLQQGRDPFAPIEAVLKSKTPAAVYRVLIQEMVANRPPLTSMRARHIHDRDCLLMLILFQTFLRIKNVAQLTYKKDDPTSQLFKADGVWYVRIHKSRFKNEHGFYFRNGDYFEMPLRDEERLYDILDRYLDVGREFIRLSNSSADTRRQQRADDRKAKAEEDDVQSGDEGIACPDDDEDGDKFGDNDDDGEPDESRLFIQLGGRQFKPSVLAMRFRWVTMRYIAESPHRDRGIVGLRAHGPHAIRHIGATDALKTTGSWEKAAQVIHDSVQVVRKIYVRWTPEDQGERAAKTAEEGRSLQPIFAPGATLVRRRTVSGSSRDPRRAIPASRTALAA